MLKLQVVSEATITIPVSPGFTNDEPTSIPCIVMFESTIWTLPKNGILTDFWIWGSSRGIKEEMALVTNKSLTKWRPFWEMTTDVKDWAVDWPGTVNNSTVRRKKIMDFRFNAMGRFFSAVFCLLLMMIDEYKLYCFFPPCTSGVACWHKEDA